MITSPRRRWSEQAFLLFPGKLYKGSHFPWIRTNYLRWRLHFPIVVYLRLCLYYIDCIFFKLLTFQFFLYHLKFNVIWVSAKNGAFNVTGKKPFFVFDDFVCFVLTRTLRIDFVNNFIDFVNNFQLIKYYSEKVILPNFLSFQNIHFWGKWRSLNAS